MQQQKTKIKQSTRTYSDNPLENVRDMGREVINDLGAESVQAMWDQILGNYSPEENQLPQNGELMEGQELDLSKKSKKTTAEQNTYTEAGIDYRREIIHGESRISHEKEQELTYQLQEIVAELQQLIKSSKELETEFKDVAVIGQPVKKAGKYHVTFFQWVLSVVRNARIRVESSASWLAMFKSKKGQKQYWAMFEKHGTSFGMSNERMVATQTG